MRRRPVALSLGVLCAGALTCTLAGPAGAAGATSPIAAKYAALGGARSFLGAPTTPVLSTPNRLGQFEHFRGGSIYWSSSTGAHEVHGAIRDAWAAKGWETSLLGFPTSDEIRLPGGALTTFQGGSVYWSPSTGAREVHGAVRDLWGSKGFERSFLGYPTSDVNPIAGGAFSTFQGGSVYTSAAGTHEVHGAIRDAWGDLGWEGGRLGWPVSDETATPDRPGAFNQFQRGSIYWSPDTPASEVEGAIRDKWAATGWENGALGFPVTDEGDIAGGRANDFEDGRVEWTPATGAVVTSGFDTTDAVDHSAHTFRIDALDQTYAYDATDHFYVVPSDPSADPTPIDLATFDAQLHTGLLVGVDQYSVDPAGSSDFYLFPDLPAAPASVRAAARAVLGH